MPKPKDNFAKTHPFEVWLEENSGKLEILWWEAKDEQERNNIARELNCTYDVLDAREKLKRLKVN